MKNLTHSPDTTPTISLKSTLGTWQTVNTDHPSEIFHTSVKERDWFMINQNTLQELAAGDPKDSSPRKLNLTKITPYVF